jgi:hypothetical protein
VLDSIRIEYAPRAGNDRFFVYIKASAIFVEQFHRPPPNVVPGSERPLDSEI